jgi:hypothetical protein
MLFPALFVPPSPGKFDTRYWVLAFAASGPCARAVARAAPQQIAVIMVKRIWLDLLVMSCVVIFVSFVEFFMTTL